MRLEECPVRPALNAIGGKWKPIIVYHLLEGTKRFGELRKLIPDATRKMLTQQLREMERDGLVARKVYHQVPAKVEYSMTDFGKTLRPIMTELCAWGKQFETRTNRRKKILNRVGRTNLSSSPTDRQPVTLAHPQRV
jgi:DNA-binding HxlR family transcriptional regulator